ncbi:DUF1963 domain-containing protein [Polaribacter sp. L3A8]|uniref:DUF1963 domain-containing protein n=1 Tax=Polaribacter sp. L3A8 TaxID=2686361 RepID=UPI00131B7DF6|nr:DUF1963 domain-containing protein [Polaribacter sp. L3A8]
MQNNSYHIVFERSYYLPTNDFGQRNNKHPTWGFEPQENSNLKFGGVLKNGINHLISFDKNFLINGIELKGRIFGLNFEDFFNAQINGPYLFYKHSENGEIERLNDNIPIEFEYCNQPLKETNIKLALTPLSFENQEWEGNCNKIGGKPIWVQEPENICCPKCKNKMTFIFQLDSGLPDLNPVNGNEIMFGNDGICYAFWCNQHKISGYLWQCT